MGRMVRWVYTDAAGMALRLLRPTYCQICPAENGDQMTDSELPLLRNRFEAEAKTHSVPKPVCHCLDAQYYGRGWRELKLHRERQDTNTPAWHRLLQLIDEAAKDQRTELSLGRELSPSDWTQIVTLPTSIAKLKFVKHFNVYGSSLVRIPPEIGQMSSLELFEPYTSYRLHWFPYELTRCKKLKDSTVSTRAIYGNFKYRAPFPRLPDVIPEAVPDTCSVCDQPFEASSVHQAWISLGVGSDVLPLLVHACSRNCISKLPKGAKRHVRHAHAGGLDLTQPPVESWSSERLVRERLDQALKERDPSKMQSELAWVAEVAIEGRFGKALQEVLDSGLDVSITSRLLISALAARDLATAKLLIERGTPIDLPDDDVTPLMEAAREGYLEGVQFLLSLGTDLDFRESESGQNAADFATNGMRDSETMRGPMPESVREEYESVLALLRSHMTERG